jgi:hypothetical protein
MKKKETNKFEHRSETQEECLVVNQTHLILIAQILDHYICYGSYSWHLLSYSASEEMSSTNHLQNVGLEIVSGS